MVKRRGPPSQGWRTFLRNHRREVAAMDLFVVPTIGFDLLYAFIIIRLDRRDLVWINVTTNPTAEWIARPVRRLARDALDRMKMHFAAVHESAYGTKRTYPRRPIFVRFRGKADINPTIRA
jgi:hypothetical protein